MCSVLLDLITNKDERCPCLNGHQLMALHSVDGDESVYAMCTLCNTPAVNHSQMKIRWDQELLNFANVEYRRTSNY